MCVCTRARRDAELMFLGPVVSRGTNSSRWPQQAAPGAAALFFSLGAVSRDWFGDMRGAWAVISVWNGWKGGPASCSLSIEVGIDLWQLSIKVRASRPPAGSVAFHHLRKMNGPRREQGRDFVCGYLKRIIKPLCISLLYLAALFITAKSLCGELCARESEDRSVSSFCCFGFSISLFGSGLTFARRCLADFLVTAVSVAVSYIRGSHFLRVTFFLVLRFRTQNE